MLILEYLGVILFVIIFIIIGYIIAINRWNVKDNLEKIEAYQELNNQLTSLNNQYALSNKSNNEIIKQNKEWYIVQLGSISTYIKDKYDDVFLEKQLNAMLGNPQKLFEYSTQELKIDDILEKIHTHGIDSLTKEELEFLKNQN